MPARSRSRSAQDVEWWWATRRVLVIGDSITRGLEAIFWSRGYVSTNWTSEVHDGTEALTVKKNQDDYDLVIYISAGNGLWTRKGKQQLKDNLNSFDVQKTIVVLLGTAEFWVNLAGGGEAADPLFFLNCRQTLVLRHVRVFQITDFMKDLEYTDKLGHLSGNAQEKIVPELMKVFAKAAGRVDGRPLGDCKVEPESDAESELGRGPRIAGGGKMSAEQDGGGGSRIPQTLQDAAAHCDVLSGEAYPGWETDLLEQHFVLSPKLKTELRGMAADKTYYCARKETQAAGGERCQGA